jgi:hypothetical protein
MHTHTHTLQHCTFFNLFKTLPFPSLFFFFFFLLFLFFLSYSLLSFFFSFFTSLGYTEAIPNIMAKIFPNSRFAAYPMVRIVYCVCVLCTVCILCTVCETVLLFLLLFFTFFHHLFVSLSLSHSASFTFLSYIPFPFLSS